MKSLVAFVLGGLVALGFAALECLNYSEVWLAFSDDGLSVLDHVYMAGLFLGGVLLLVARVLASRFPGRGLDRVAASLLGWLVGGILGGLLYLTMQETINERFMWEEVVTPLSDVPEAASRFEQARGELPATITALSDTIFVREEMDFSPICDEPQIIRTDEDWGVRVECFMERRLGYESEKMSSDGERYLAVYKHSTGRWDVGRVYAHSSELPPPSLRLGGQEETHQVSF